MGFFNGIKRALGFSENGDEHDDELDGIDGRAARSPYVNPFKNDKPAADEPNKTPSQPYTEPTTSVGDAEEGLVEGNISNLIYQGDHYSYVIHTDLGQDFVVYDEDLWNMGDRVGLVMPTEKMSFALKKQGR